MQHSGFSLIETAVALAIIASVAALAAPTMLSARDDARARGAADHVASVLHLARLEALKRNVNVALRFEEEGEEVRFRMYADGNGNGVRTAETRTGIDPALGPGERLTDQFPGVRFAVDEGVTAIDADTTAEGEALRLGASRMASFSPLGTSSSGTVFLLGRGHHQFAVRLLGPTGRIRVLEYSYGVREWSAR